MENTEEYEEEKCHCGKEIYTYPELNFTRGMCQECSTVRCDLAEGPCPNA